VNVQYWIMAVLAMTLIAFSKAGFGGSLGVLATPMMATVCSPKTAIAVMLPVMILCDVWCVIIYSRKCVWRKVLSLLTGFIIGLGIATFLMAKISGQEIWLRGIIGTIAITFSLLYFLFKNKKVEKYVPQRRWFGIVVGIAAGISSTLAHAAGPLTAMYFLSQGQKKENFMGSITVYCLIGNVLKVPSYIWSGIITIETLFLVWPFLFIAPLGILLGWYLNKRLSDTNFEGWINGVLIIIGFYLLAV